MKRIILLLITFFLLGFANAENDIIIKNMPYVNSYFEKEGSIYAVGDGIYKLEGDSFVEKLSSFELPGLLLKYGEGFVGFDYIKKELFLISLNEGGIESKTLIHSFEADGLADRELAGRSFIYDDIFYFLYRDEDTNKSLILSYDINKNAEGEALEIAELRGFSPIKTVNLY